jgi:hypothetical protein
MKSFPALVLVIAFAFLLQACESSPTFESVVLSMQGSSTALGVGPVETEQVLQPGLVYEVTVRGTISVWSEDEWEAGSCPAGMAEGAPPRGSDAAYVFARPRIGDCDPSEFPEHVRNLQFSLDGGRTWRHYDATSGYRENHVYTFRLEGEGHPLMARFLDNPTHDNYGQLRITVGLGEAP